MEPVVLVSKAPVPPHVRDRLLFAVELETAVDTVIAPALSIKKLPEAIADTRSEALMFTAAPEAFAWTSPSKRDPPLVALSVTVTEPGINVGDIVKEVPTNASAVNARVLAPLPTLDVKPRSVKVATPLTVLTVTEVTAVPEFPTLRTCPVAVTVMSNSSDPFPALT
jgi:hypothetical protein